MSGGRSQYQVVETNEGRWKPIPSCELSLLIAQQPEELYEQMDMTGGFTI